MKKTIIYMAALAAMAAASCTALEERAVLEQEPLDAVSRSITPKEALDNLDCLIAELYDGTKSGIPTYDPANLTVYGGIATKSDGEPLPDTTLYIINFTDEAGFAVLAGRSDMVTPVLCITESGSLTAEDLERAMQQLDGYPLTRSSEDGVGYNDSLIIGTGEDFVPMLLAASVANQISPQSTGGNGPNDDGNDVKQDLVINPEDPGNGGSGRVTRYHYESVQKTGPLLTTKWTQSGPFNDFLGNEGIPAGCVAIAAGQVLAHNEYGSAGGRTFDWDLLKTVYHYSSYNKVYDSYYPGSEEAQDAVSEFIQFVGNYDNCRVRYNEDGSWALADGVKRTFDNFNYGNVKKLIGFEKADKETINSTITKNYPVVTVAVKGLKSAHAWVIDGLYIRNKVNDDTDRVMETQHLYHINWGWAGDRDGYFHQGVFDTAQRVEIDDTTDPGTSDMNGCSYGWLFRSVVYSL